MLDGGSVDVIICVTCSSVCCEYLDWESCCKSVECGAVDIDVDVVSVVSKERNR